MTDQPAHISTTANIHLYGAVTAEPKFHLSASADPGQDWQTYGYVTLARNQGTSDLTIFVQDREQAAAISAAFATLAAQFPEPEPEPAPHQGRIVHRLNDDSATPVAGVLLDTAGALPEYAWVLWDGADTPTREAMDELTPGSGLVPVEPDTADALTDAAERFTRDLTADYPARVFVMQRDPADPESWVYRCGEDHVSSGAAVLPCSAGWQSPDYPSEGDALISAKDHARAMHDMGLPSALAERADAAERAAAESLAPSGPAE